MLNVYRERARMAFEYADTRFERALNKRQYQIAMTAVFGYFPDKMEVKHVLRSRTDGISYDEFEYWVSKKCDASNPSVNADTLFYLLDRNYRGYLLLEDFCFASKAVGLRITLPVWQRVFKELDHRDKGYIELEEFQCALLAP